MGQAAWAHSNRHVLSQQHRSNRRVRRWHAKWSAGRGCGVRGVSRRDNRSVIICIKRERHRTGGRWRISHFRNNTPAAMNWSMGQSNILVLPLGGLRRFFPARQPVLARTGIPANLDRHFARRQRGDAYQRDGHAAGPPQAQATRFLQQINGIDLLAELHALFRVANARWAWGTAAARALTLRAWVMFYTP